MQHQRQQRSFRPQLTTVSPTVIVPRSPAALNCLRLLSPSNEQVMKGTIVASLLQPTPEVYGLFDDIILLRHGQARTHPKSIFSAPSSHVLPTAAAAGAGRARIADASPSHAAAPSLQVLYHGSRKELPGYFQGLGFTPPPADEARRETE